MLEEILATVNVDLGNIPQDIQSSYQTLTTMTIEHHYPIPSDELSAKQLALTEVQTNVRSHQSYIEEFSKKEKADKEWERILEELAQLDEISAGALPVLANELNEQEEPQDETSGEDEVDDKEKEQTEQPTEEGVDPDVQG